MYCISFHLTYSILITERSVSRGHGIKRHRQGMFARHGGLDVAGWTMDKEIRVRFLAYTSALCVCWPSDDKEVKDVFGLPSA